jgi:hypothetical protein
MLAYTREYTDGKYYYALIPMKDMGNVVILENKLTNTLLKRYFTTDDEAAIIIFESLIDLQEERGSEEVEKYKISDMLGKEFASRVKIECE